MSRPSSAAPPPSVDGVVLEASPPPAPSPTSAQLAVQLVLGAGAGTALALLLWPFLPALVTAGVLALILHPVHRRQGE